MKTVVLNFTHLGNKEVLVLLAPDDMDVQAEIAECRTRSSRIGFSRECRSSTVYDWLRDRGCLGYDKEIVMIDGWHEPPMTRPRSENCNVPLVEPYIRIGEMPDNSDRGDWVSDFNRQAGASDAPFPAPGHLTHEECVARAIRRPANRGEISIAGIQMPYETVENTTEVTLTYGRPVEWRPRAGSGWTATVGQINPTFQWTPTAISPEVFDELLSPSQMREIGRRAARISERLAAESIIEPTTQDQD